MSLRLFADALGCDLSSLKKCALQKTVSEILQAQLKVKSIMMLSPFAPVVDGYFLTGTVFACGHKDGETGG